MSANIYDAESKKLIPFAGNPETKITADYDANNRNLIFLCQSPSPAKYEDGDIDFT